MLTTHPEGNVSEKAACFVMSSLNLGCIVSKYKTTRIGLLFKQKTINLINRPFSAIIYAQIDNIFMKILAQFRERWSFSHKLFVWLKYFQEEVGKVTHADQTMD